MNDSITGRSLFSNLTPYLNTLVKFEGDIIKESESVGNVSFAIDWSDSALRRADVDFQNLILKFTNAGGGQAVIVLEEEYERLEGEIVLRTSQKTSTLTANYYAFTAGTTSERRPGRKYYFEYDDGYVITGNGGQFGLRFQSVPIAFSPGDRIVFKVPEGFATNLRADYEACLSGKIKWKSIWDPKTDCLDLYDLIMHSDSKESYIGTVEQFQQTRGDERGSFSVVMFKIFNTARI